MSAYKDEDNAKGLTAKQLIAALMDAIRDHGDLPVQMSAWMSDDEDKNDAVGYVWPYDKDGGSSSDVAYFYLHGIPIQGSPE